MGLRSFYKPSIKILYNGVDKTDEFNWTSISIEDNERDLADRFIANMSYHNARPRMKDSIEVFINNLFLGKFIISRVSVDYKKSFSIEAVSVDFMSDFTKNKNRTFENQSYKEIIESIAKENGYETKIDFERMDEITVLEQHDKSDMNLCHKIAKDLELTFCVKNGYLIFYDRDNNSHRVNYFYNADDSISLTYKKREKEVYKSCEVRWHDTKGAKYKVARVGTQEPCLNITSMAKDKDSALKLAKSKLKNQNNLEIKGSMEIMGEAFFAGGFINILFDDGKTHKFIIKKATHKIDRSWTTTIEFF
ncbi:phage tail protein [Campylobacter sp. FMV-PI01]|uniref:Phage tail protein n=1 Tax=Campylobacter portucalensis TaxID=2608384 RepID=A0A6L5WIP0_9BACT|nr:phage tail protein [Campylobacter portucalensis]MSN96342.1 phage tail protein [Campylobacter portucalensis]